MKRVSGSELGEEGFYMGLDIGLISYCCCKKLPNTWWLKTIKINFLTILEELCKCMCVSSLRKEYKKGIGIDVEKANPHYATRRSSLLALVFVDVCLMSDN